ncbi:MAG: hypothetical protein QOJ09_2156 [Actinomycetota bacterium]|nr:hypothetical protein [Actinomycetota bacterium]
MTARPSRRMLLGAVPGLVLAACGVGRKHATAQRKTAAAPARSSTTAVTSPPDLPAFVRHGDATTEAVALTFHGSGDVALLDKLLTVAADRSAPLTVFAVGQWLDANPSLARRLIDGGHEVANHTYTHPSLGHVVGAALRDEIVRCREALTRHAGEPGRWFRPSGVVVPSQTILDAAAAAGYRTVVGYDVDPRDYQDPGAAAVRSRTIAGLHPGAIVSLHTGHAGTVEALPAILDAIEARALRPVTVSRLLA